MLPCLIDGRACGYKEGGAAGAGNGWAGPWALGEGGGERIGVAVDEGAPALRVHWQRKGVALLCLEMRESERETVERERAEQSRRRAPSPLALRACLLEKGVMHFHLRRCRAPHHFHPLATGSPICSSSRPPPPGRALRRSLACCPVCQILFRYFGCRIPSLSPRVTPRHLSSTRFSNRAIPSIPDHQLALSPPDSRTLLISAPALRTLLTFSRTTAYSSIQFC
jgi:hypothetical protein